MLTVPLLAHADEDELFWGDEEYESSRPKAEEKAPKAEEKAPEKTEAKASDAPRQLQQQPAIPTGPIAVVVRTGDATSGDAALAFERQLSKAFAAEGRLKPVSLMRKLGGATEPETRPDVQAHLDAGRKAYENLELDVAADEYLAALKMMLERPETAIPSKVAYAFTLSGAAYALNGDANRAEAAYRHAAVIAPGWTPPETDFSPDIIEAFNAARAAAEAGEKGELTVTANASPALVFVDGREAGVAPLKLDGLSVGRHHLVVRCRAHAPWATFVQVSGSRTSSAQANLEPLPAAAPLDRSLQTALSEAAAGRAGPGSAELGKLLEASYLVVGTARTDPAAGSLVDYSVLELSTGRVASSGQRPVVPGAPSFEADMKALAPQLSSSLLDPVLVADAGGESKPVMERWWFWPAVGGVAAIAAGAAVYGIVSVASGHSGPPTLITTGIP